MLLVRFDTDKQMYSHNNRLLCLGSCPPWQHAKGKPCCAPFERVPQNGSLWKFNALWSCPPHIFSNSIKVSILSPDILFLYHILLLSNSSLCLPHSQASLFLLLFYVLPLSISQLIFITLFFFPLPILVSLYVFLSLVLAGSADFMRWLHSWSSTADLRSTFKLFSKSFGHYMTKTTSDQEP